MELNDPTATINALLCACVVITLMFYRRGDSRHRPWVSRLLADYCYIQCCSVGLSLWDLSSFLMAHYRGEHYFSFRAGGRQRQRCTSG